MEYTSKELQDFTNLYKQKSRTFMGMNSKGVGLNGRNIILDWATFNDVMALNNDFVFNMLVQMAGSDGNSLLCLVDCKLRCKSAYIE